MTLREFRKMLRGMDPEAEVAIEIVVDTEEVGLIDKCRISAVERNRLRADGSVRTFVAILFECTGDTCNS